MLRILALIVATLAASGVMAWTVANAVDSSKATAQASAQASLERSELLIAKQEQQMQAALLGECNGRNALTDQLNVAHRVLRRVLLQASVLTREESRHARRASPKTVQAERALANDYASEARAVKGVSRTDCAQELAHPLSYKQPGATNLP